MIIAAQSLSTAEESPRQCKLLGATVRGLGMVTAVSSTLFDCYALIEDAQGYRHHRFLADLSKDELTFPLELQPFYTAVERIAYGTWDEVHALVSDQPMELRAAA